MRIKITLSQGSKRQIIPINYNYFISSFLYRTIETADSEYSKWLHDTGYASGSKSFKYFTFSGLYIPDRELVNGRYIKINSPKMDLTVSMMSDKAVEKFIVGMFEKKNMKICNRDCEAEFDINTIETVPDPDFSGTMEFRAMSPIVISKKTLYKDKISATYISPEDEEYEGYLKRNLSEKFSAYPLKKMSGDSMPVISNFEYSGEVRSKLVSIREGEREETKVRGFIYRFRLKGSPELMKFGYEAGFGNLCSLGFGCVSARRV